MKKLLVSVVILILLLNVTAYAATNADKPILKITEVNYQQLESNETYDLTITLTNVGNTYGDDASITLYVPEETPITIKDQILYQNIPYVYVNGEIELTYTITVDSGVDTGFYKLGLEGTYFDSDKTQYNYEETFNIEIVDGKNDAILKAEVVDNTRIVAGENNQITVAITNTGDGNAWAVVPTIINTDTIFRVGESDQYLSTLESKKTAEFDFTISVDDDVLGFTPISLEVTYLTGNGESTQTLNTYIDVQNELSGDLIIEKVEKSSNTIMPDEQVTFDVTLTHMGLVDLEDVKIEVSQDPALVPASQSVVLVNSFKANTSEVVSFVMQATDSAITQNYPLEFTVTYEGNEVTQYSGVNILNDDEEDEEETLTKPRIIITEFSLSKDKIFLGDTFDMAFSVSNTSLLKDIRNLKVVLETSTNASSESVFLPLNQSNSFFVSELEAGQGSEISIPLKVFANAEGKSYSLEIQFEYEDYDGVLYTDSETISIPVYEKSELTVSDVRVGTSLDTGYTLELDFYNTGKVDITNMMVDLEGDFTTTNSNYYVGDFATGRTDVYDVEIIGQQANVIEGNIVFTYDDTFGEEETFVKSFKIGTEDSSSQAASDATGGRPSQGSVRGASGANANANTNLGEMTPEQIEELRGMSAEERTTFMENGGFNTESSMSNIMSIVLYVVVGLIAIVVVIVIVIVIRRKKGRD